LAFYLRISSFSTNATSKHIAWSAFQGDSAPQTDGQVGPHGMQNKATLSNSKAANFLKKALALPA
jgi:hypothetical protein